MSAAFSQFCTASQAGYNALRQCIDLCARQEHSYEFPGCLMPDGCVPERALLSFSRQRDGSYLLYWRPAVDYHGASRVLAALFRRNLWRFQSYETLAERLSSLRWELGRPTAAAAAAQNWPEPCLRLIRDLSQSVLGQDQAVEAAAFRLYSHLEKRKPARPLSLVFYGPTGVGKSELGKALAPALERCRGERYQSVWTELNTFTQPHSVHRLTGAPPGYVGYEDQPILEAVRRNPRTVFMFDELEKAHPEVLKVFMSILDEGRCTAHRADESGDRELDFRRCVFVFTTNADLSPSGARPLGFSCRGGDAPQPEKKAATPAELAERLFQENEEARQAMVRQGVLREIAGRFSALIRFQPLDAAARLAIAVKQIISLGQEFGLRIIQVDPATVRALSPEREALSVRSMTGVLEGVLTPVFAQAALNSRGAFRLTGLPGSLRLIPAYPATSSTVPVSVSSL